MWFQKVIGDPHLDGFWMCPTPNCGGAGFTFDIFPTDPDHPANAGWYDCDEEEFDEMDEAAVDQPWDPAEAKYAGWDEEEDDWEEDIEGEEWKHVLTPEEAARRIQAAEESRRIWEEEQKKYAEPDRRPRVIDWTNWPTEQSPIDENDVPF